MKKNALVLSLILSVFGTTSIFAQEGGSVAAREKKYDVNLTASAINFAPAQLDTVIFREGKKLREEFRLSFANFSGIKEIWQNSRLILIGYNKDGTPFGGQSWLCGNGPGKETLSQNPNRVTLVVSDYLNGANNYRLDLVGVADLFLAETCAECVALANDTCGRAKVASVTCGGDGSCAFTCR